ncbi:MAG: type I DNA topoisomerase [bacterium]|nr:type I DNA topoisomerase [bacterium]
MAKSLVIVESPAKAKTINKILGKSFTVTASMGHVRDLPKNRIGVEIENDFAPRYVIPAKNRKLIAQLRRAARAAARIYLAPDPDREGEAIAWHLREVLAPAKRPIRRVAFNEITERAVREAFASPGEIDGRKVDSQQARRILDRIVGYKLSPLLWRKVARGLSAGRVQSVAVRLICDREVEIRNFRPEEYWTIEAALERAEAPHERFTARLVGIDGGKADIRDGEHARRVSEEARAARWAVVGVTEKEQRRRPPAPFITSTLQQAGVNRLRWPIARTMKVAQELYEGLELGAKGSVGLITYMRTDSVRVSDGAQAEALDYIRARYGDPYAPRKPNVHRSRKGAQGAHEAIRPTSIARDPDAVRPHLTKEQHALYALIWNRFTASQMSPAVLKKVTADISAGPFLFRAGDTKVLFPGWLRVERQEVRGEDEAELPPLRPGEALTCRSVEPSQHFTSPPPRYTEATLVRELEEKGIGRPSTYAPIIATIRKRRYVEKAQGRLAPTPLGETVNGLLVDGFPELINVEFTARMEEELDEIESGAMRREQVLRDFYAPFMESLAKAEHTMKTIRKPSEPTSARCAKCGHPMVIRHTLRGEFLACSAFPRCRNTMPIAAEEDGSFRIEEAATLDEACPKCGKPLMERHGRYGKFIACSGYPACRYVKPDYVGVACPRPGCGGQIVRRRGRGGTRFFGCANYPACRFRARSPEELQHQTGGAPGAQAGEGGGPGHGPAR